MKYTTKESLKTAAVVCIWPTAMVLWVVGSCNVSQHQCKVVCKANGDPDVYVINDGCYCKDSRGLYNPRDSR